jgi:hypothetical protein
MTTIEAYPLHWPASWPREENPRYSAFTTSIPKARKGLMDELRKLGATNIVISSNSRVNNYGEVVARKKAIDDTGVAVYFDLDGEQRCIPCDRWIHLKDNLHAIELTVAALRGLDRWGTHQVVQAAFQGFAALPAGNFSEPEKDPWWIVLGIRRDAPRSEIEREYRSWAKLHHPDVGGDSGRFREVTDAYREAIATK